MELENIKLTYEAKLLLLRILQAGETTSKQLNELLQILNYPLIHIHFMGEELNGSIEVRPPII